MHHAYAAGYLFCVSAVSVTTSFRLQANLPEKSGKGFYDIFVVAG